MSKQWCYIFFMIWFTYLIVSSVLLFSRGFLLSKNAQNTNSTCLPLSQLPCSPKETSISSSHEDTCSHSTKFASILQDIDSASTICLPQKARVILVIIDALRYDFAVINNSLTSPDYYQNKLPVIDRLLKQYPEQSRLYKFIADPPTTTMQRLKALTTGSLPTFIDAGSNFATNEINEDNIIDQLLRRGLGTVLIGDDTWDGLYPDRFLRKYPYPSFDVWDLDTVDDGVNLHLKEELHQNDWDLLIAHYLGVDHCGHRYGPSHPEMDRKLTEMNAVIENIVATLDSNTMLFVIGDHGMTETGNHGGDAADEVTSAFFLHSKKSLTPHNHTEEIRQISIVPTMAAIFGVPIPFSNLGTVVLDALPIVNSSYIHEWQVSLFYMWGNVRQMLAYIESYAETSSETFSHSDLEGFRERFAVLKERLEAVGESNHQEFVGECESFLTELREKCEKVWIQFDAFSMTRGLLFLFLSLFFVYMITDGIPSDRLPEIFMSSFLTCSYSALILAAASATVLYYFRFVTNLTSTIFFATGLVSQVMLAMLVVQNWEVIALHWYERSKSDRTANLICRLLLILHLAGLFSNSFVVEESSVLLFLLATLIVLTTLSSSLLDTKKKTKVRWKLIFIAVAALALIRLSMYFWRCRDRLEQPWCYNSNNPFLAKGETTKLQWITTVVVLGLFVTVTKTWLKNCGNLSDYSLNVVLLKFVPTVLVVCTGGYWVLNRFPLDGRKSFQPWQANLLAWIVYALSTSGIVVVLFKPLYVYIVPGSTEIENQTNVIPELFNKVKKLFNEPREDVPIVCGLGTAYSAVFVSLGVYLSHLFALLHGDAAATSTVLMFLAAILVIVVTSIIRLQRATSVEQLFEIPNISILIWVILAQYFFYGTGHQPSFPNIIWDAAFVGTSGVLRHNFVLGSLIIINTFCSQILMGLLLPLHLIVPFTISLMMPSVVGKNVLDQENLRGEVLLYERSSSMLTVAFTTSCKYMICHGLRVFATMLTATIHCRHMMIWKIFAPKFIFESVGMFVTLAMVNVGYLVLMRINCKVDGLVTTLNKRFK